MLKIKKELLEKIKSQAEKDYPYETCGIMIGKEEQRDGGRLFLLFVTLTIVCCKWVETQGGNL